jgi:hypothetical protein
VLRGKFIAMNVYINAWWLTPSHLGGRDRSITVQGQPRPKPNTTTTKPKKPRPYLKNKWCMPIIPVIQEVKVEGRFSKPNPGKNHVPT